MATEALDEDGKRRLAEALERTLAGTVSPEEAIETVLNGVSGMKRVCWGRRGYLRRELSRRLSKMLAEHYRQQKEEEVPACATSVTLEEMFGKETAELMQREATERITEPQPVILSPQPKWNRLDDPALAYLRATRGS